MIIDDEYNLYEKNTSTIILRLMVEIGLKYMYTSTSRTLVSQ